MIRTACVVAVTFVMNAVAAIASIGLLRSVELAQLITVLPVSFTSLERPFVTNAMKVTESVNPMIRRAKLARKQTVANAFTSTMVGTGAKNAPVAMDTI